MHTVIIGLSVVLGGLFVIGGLAKLAAVAFMRTEADHLGFSYRAYRCIGVLDLAGGLGLLVGLAHRPLAVAAAIGLVAMTVGAVACHARVKDPVMTTAAPAVVGLLALIIAVGASIA